MHRLIELSALAACLLPAAVAFAQPEPPTESDPEMVAPARSDPKPDHGERMLRMLERKVKLQANQKKTIEAVIKESQPEMERLQKEMQELHERMRKFERKQHEQVRALLDDDQKEKFDELTVQMNGRMEMGGPGDRGGHFGPRRRPGPPSDNEDREEMDPRELPPPEMWQPGPGAPKSPLGQDGGRKPPRPEGKP